MNETDEIAKKINQLLLKDSLVISYKKYEELLKSMDIKGIEEEVKALQKVIASQKSKDNGNITDDLLNDYKDKVNIINNHPLVVNYLFEKEELNQKLQEIITIIQQNL